MGEITSEQLRAARALLRWEQKDLAERSGVSPPSLKRLELKPGPLRSQSMTTDALRRALETAGIIFVEENGEGAGVRMRRFRPGDIVKAREGGRISGIRIEKGQTGVVTVVESETNDLGSKYRVTVRFAGMALPLRAPDLEFVEAVRGNADAPD